MPASLALIVAEPLLFRVKVPPLLLSVPFWRVPPVMVPKELVTVNPPRSTVPAERVRDPVPIAAALERESCPPFTVVPPK